MNYTPGPWKVVLYPSKEKPLTVAIESDNGCICDMVSVLVDDYANAALIAAAPDLLAALEDIRDKARSRLVPDALGPSSLSRAGTDKLDHIAAKADAAIKRVEGNDL